VRGGFARPHALHFHIIVTISSLSLPGNQFFLPSLPLPTYLSMLASANYSQTSRWNPHISTFAAQCTPLLRVAGISTQKSPARILLEGSGISEIQSRLSHGSRGVYVRMSLWKRQSNNPWKHIPWSIWARRNCSLLDFLPLFNELDAAAKVCTRQHAFHWRGVISPSQSHHLYRDRALRIS
jgi:hypothetical protein